MVQVLVGLQGNSSRSPSSSFLAWVPGEYARHRLDHGGIGLGSNFGLTREILNKIKLNEA
jgi:hypothetical protein